MLFLFIAYCDSTADQDVSNRIHGSHCTLPVLWQVRDVCAAGDETIQANYVGIISNAEGTLTTSQEEHKVWK